MTDGHCRQPKTSHHEHSGHGHWHGGRLKAWRHKLGHAITPHSHDAADKVDSAMETSREGLRAQWISLAILGATAITQAVVVVFSGSVALLGDTLHNASDALTAIPLGIAFILGRRPATRSYTYGYGRAEDLAGVVTVVFIAASAALAGYEAVRRLINPTEVSHLPWVAAAAIVDSSVTKSWPASASPSVGGSARRRWSPTGYTPEPTGSPPWPCCSAWVVSRSGGDGSIR